MERFSMSSPIKPQVSHFEPPHVSLRTYLYGFLSCVALTLIAYAVAVTDAVSAMTAVIIIAALALVQFLVQLVGFLHLGQEFKPRWKLGVFILMLSIVCIVIAGSLWIMSNLNYRMIHNPGEMRDYVERQAGF